MDKELHLVRQRLIAAEVERKDALYQLSQVRKEKASADLVKLYIKHASNSIDKERDLWEREKSLYNARCEKGAVQVKHSSSLCWLPEKNESLSRSTPWRRKDDDSDAFDREWHKRREHLDTLMKMTT